MRMYNIIEKKRDNKELSREEINFFVEGYCNNTITDYEMSALLMAIYINGMSEEELTYLTIAMANSSSKLDLDELESNSNYIVDKHSTGGVGDKITLIVLPIVASLGVKVFKMSGRGLGFTGGTADKLESIVGYDINLPLDRAKQQVKDIGLCLISQSKDLAIADKKIYALRNATATVESKNLIASSIMSKKIASGTKRLLLDVTVGTGAFMKTTEDALDISNIMIKIGKKVGIETKALITDMSEPLGRNVGNAMEIKEVISFLLSDNTTLFSDNIKDLTEIVLAVSAWMIKMAGLGDNIEENKIKVIDAITSKKAYNKFIELIKAQGGHIYNVYMDWIGMSLDMPVLKDEVKYLKEIKAQNSGYIVSIDSKKIGEALVVLGGGRKEIEDKIDYSVGFEFVKKVGDKVLEGDTILKCLYNDKDKFEEAFEYIEQAIYIDNIEKTLADTLKNKPHILDIV